MISVCAVTRHMFVCLFVIVVLVTAYVSRDTDGAEVTRRTMFKEMLCQVTLAPPCINEMLCQVTCAILYKTCRMIR